MRTYKLDTDAAKNANNGGKRITEPGVYAGKIRAAWGETTKNGAEGVFIQFDCENGQEIGPLALYTHDKDGKAISGYDALNAIMTCVRVRELVPTKGKVTVYDYDTKADVEKTKDVFLMLAGKPVGLLLRQEEYENREGDLKTRLVIAGSFDPATKQMATEILAKSKDAIALTRAAEWLEKNPVKPLKGKRAASNGAAPSGGNGAPFVDDDLESVPW